MLKIVILISLVVLVAADYNIYEILQGIPEEQRLDFMKHHINKGKELSATRIAQKDNTMFDEYPEDFSVFLYEYAVDKHQIEDEDRLKQLREIVCFDDGTCIDLGNIGTRP